MKLIGLSLSNCVKDILEGKVDWGDVLFVISGTMIIGEETFKKVIDLYSNSYWRDFSEDKIEECVTRLFLQGIVQPRLFGLEPPNISEGHWIEVSDYKINKFIEYLNKQPKEVMK